LSEGTAVWSARLVRPPVLLNLTLWTGTLAALFGAGVLAITIACLHLPSYSVLQPGWQATQARWASSDRLLSNALGAPASSETFQEAMRSLPTGKPLLFVGQATDAGSPGSTFEVMYYLTVYLAWPTHVWWQACGNGPTSPDLDVLPNPPTPFGGVIFYHVPRTPTDVHAVTLAPGLTVSTVHQEDALWPSVCP
jgi:hypothetical protein